MSKIKALSENLINQIAAGEMIDRPASIIKELVENAIDAGANKISINFVNGGMSEITINDNGEGISKDDLPLALTRHATSKISSFEDLQNINTMGFRGEALAAISSAANILITTSTDGMSAYSINAEAGKVGKVTPANRERGTSIVVRDLFFNIPARKQFLKTELTESSHCLETCRRLALSNPNIDFCIFNNRKILWQVSAEDENSRIAALLSKDLLINKRTFSEDTVLFNQTINIRGMLILPSANTPNKEHQYLFVNNRFVRDRTILAALREGYGQMKHDAKNLAFVLFVNLPPNEVDVNVSPNKTEVRFRKSGEVYSLVRKCVAKALAGKPGEYSPPILSFANNSNNIAQNINQQTQISNSAGANFAQNYKSLSQSLPKDIGNNTSKNHSPNFLNYKNINPNAQEISAAINLYNPSNISNPNQNLSQAQFENESLPLGYAIGLLHNLYILAQNQEGLVVVEIHAAHERILLEKLKRQKADKLLAQNLLVPWRVILDDVQTNTFTKFENFLAENGIHGKVSGKELILNAVPAAIINIDYQHLIIEILNQLSEYEHSPVINDLYEQVLATIACHGAMRGQVELTISQMNELLREMENIERSGSCNHGRPSYALFPLINFDQFFMRGK